MASSSSSANTGNRTNVPCAAGDVVVWEWFNEYGRWRPYSPEIVVHIEKVGQVAPQVPLGAVSQSLRMYVVDIPSMCQIRQGTGTSRPVRRVYYPAKSPPGQQILWEWAGDVPNEWHTYDMEIAVLIEEAFHSGRGMMDLSTSQFRLPYTIHFTTMQQVRIQTGKARSIRRTALTTPYPDAQRAPKSLQCLTSQLPSTLMVNGIGSQPSTSSLPGPSHSQSVALMLGASGSLPSKRSYNQPGNDSSGSESDDGSGRSPHGRHSKFRRSTRSHSAASNAVGSSNSSSKSRKSTGLPSATQTSNSVQVSQVSGSLASISHMASVQSSMSGAHPQSLVVSSSRQQAQPVLNINPPVSSLYPMPTVSLVTVGAPVPLSLITYAQPLGANLTRGFPPMTHVPPGSNSKSQQYQLVQQQGAATSWPNPIHASNIPSASQTLGMMASSQSQPNSSLHSLSQSHPHSQPQTSQGQVSMVMSSSYHGPITRNRLSTMKVQSHTPHAHTHTHLAGGGMTGMNGLNPHVHAASSTVNSTAGHMHKSVSVPNMVLGGYHPSQSSGVMNLMTGSVHQHHPHQQQHVTGMGISNYPFTNQQTFLMPLGMNMLGQHGLPLSSASGGQHNRIAPTIPGGLAPHTQSASQPAESLPQAQKIVLPKLKKTKPKTAEEVLSKYMEKVAPQENEDCCICCDALTGPSSYGEGRPGQFDVIQLNKCSHMFHRLCLLAMYDSSHNHDSIQCPTCKTIYGEYLGNCPPGEMNFDIIHRSLPGYPGSNSIRVMYHISPGTQGPEHPHPGRRFTARGFPRTGYLPDTDRGRKILKMLIVAFKRRLMFTIGQSATTGEGDTVTWNEIHHKTEFGSNVSGHGYPDPNYLDNVTAELALKGVTEQDL